MDLKRITVDEVLAAYAATGLRPTKAAYHWLDDVLEEDHAPQPHHCGCPAFVVALVRTGTPVEQACRGEGAANFTHKQFSGPYLRGFTFCVDTGRLDTDASGPLMGDGMHDGLAVRAALWPEPANA